MTQKGPVHREMEERLTVAFPDASFILNNDSARHHGHAGDDGSGESHFSLTIEWAGFAGQNRVARQRTVNRALGDLPGQRVHALAIKAIAPGE
ncbi:MAG: BolA family transcriptional regulator [Alphaproteobacteria bacterium HGW-Alphaproteobacteria-13]|nr:MAG: BolA family transcriptional regulator [Alphaproteobacteria bacterium HGW-Alphaproteobacteria-13]